MSIKLKHETLFYPVLLMKKQAQKGEFAPGYKITDSDLSDSKVKTSILSPHCTTPLLVISQRDTPVYSLFCGNDACSPSQIQKDKSTAICASQTVKCNAEPHILPTRTPLLKTKSRMLAWCPVSAAWISVMSQLADSCVSQQAITQL